MKYLIFFLFLVFPSLSYGPSATFYKALELKKKNEIAEHKLKLDMQVDRILDKRDADKYNEMITEFDNALIKFNMELSQLTDLSDLTRDFSVFKKRIEHKIDAAKDKLSPKRATAFENYANKKLLAISSEIMALKMAILANKKKLDKK